MLKIYCQATILANAVVISISSVETKNYEMKKLKLTLKKEWFDMVLSGEKYEEYREIKPYWISRLIKNRYEMESQVYDEMCNDLKEPLLHHSSVEDLLKFFNCDWVKYGSVEFTNGYSKKSPMVTKEIYSIDIGVGLYVMGAPNVNVFRIKLGKEVCRLNC